jgi:hypothetical protein
MGKNPSTNIFYSTKAELGNVTETLATSSSHHEEPMDNKDHSYMELVKALPELDDEDLKSAVLSADSKVSSRRLGGRVDKANLKPIVLEKEKLVILPSTVTDANNYIGHYMMKAARMLGYKVRIIPYNGELKEISEHSIDVSLGIYMSLEDETANFTFREKKDPYELGRTYARSQQIIGVLSAKERLGPDILKMNELYFGNYRVPKGTSEKTAKKGSDYWIHSAGTLFTETKFRDSMVKVLITLLRRSWVLVAPDILWNNIYPYIIEYNTIVKETCGKEVVISPAKKNKPAITKIKIPSRPRANNLLLKHEMDFLQRISTVVWEPTPWESLSGLDWASVIFNEGLSAVKKDLSQIYNRRNAFLVRFASLTTKRLNRLRAVGKGAGKTTRKADIKVEHLTELLISPEDPYEEFVGELLNMDPAHNLFLASYCTGIEMNDVPDSDRRVVTQRIHDVLYEELRKTKLYDDIKKKSEDQSKKLEAILEAISKRNNEQATFISELKEKYGSATVSKWHRNINYNFKADAKALGSLKKPKWDRAVTVIDKTVPHETSKAPPKPSKKKAEGEMPLNIKDHWLKRRQVILDTLIDADPNCDITDEELGVRAAFATFAEHKNVPLKYKNLTKYMGAPPSQALVESCVKLLLSEGRDDTRT